MLYMICDVCISYYIRCVPVCPIISAAWDPWGLLWVASWAAGLEICPIASTAGVSVGNKNKYNNDELEPCQRINSEILKIWGIKYI